MNEQIYEITLKQNLNIQSSSEIEKNTNLIEKEDLETYDKYSYSADYNYKKKKFIPRSFSFNKNLLLIFICFLLGWGAITPNISIVYERLSKGKASTSISEFNYVPIDETDPLFSKDYITAGSAIEIYWTVAETGIIAKLTPIKTANGFICPAEDGGLKVEDEILKINNYPLIEKEKWSTITSADPINVTVKRAGEVLDISITPALAVETNSFKIGIEYLINKAYSQTASTLTFIDYDTGKFASTAHVVEFSKEDEEALKIPNISKLSEGIVFNAKVIGKKSDGLETESISRIGKITSNNDFGVYGIIDNT
ncbi:MAG: PDZ domain-containing protein, partial [Clostridia bacterium]